MRPRNKNILFWVLQLVGWSVLDATIFIVPLGFSKTYLFFSFMVSTVFGIAVTFGYRWYLKQYVGLEFDQKRKYIRLLLAFIATCGLYFMLIFTAEHFYDAYIGRTAEEKAFIKENFNYALAFANAAFTMLCWTVLYFVINFSIRANKNSLERLELNSTLREAQLNTLKGQVNPHFMFNSLNNIRGLMLEDVPKSKEMITKLSEMLEFSMTKNSVDSITVKEELEMVRNYVGLSKIQMEERLKYDEDIDPECLRLKIPPMVIQLLVENAAKHGISKLKEGGVIRLQITKSAQTMSILVSNTGKLLMAKDTTQLGLANIRKRLSLLYGPKAVFKLEEIADHTVGASIQIPLIP
ncbi:Signal transduction histidine kinase, LytS [Croceitalea dokdonensis DOKDO 023]|uniref:Signal transduction histidine kinase, LytS n=1 Tax=Croceitalea dokdonensis DOKDO 023 TaxID=1300341 RepID=A0A0P7A6W4_9FLAO|nr:histidine kinase [Croceitalea dokdonensis]KPM32503.1 Signal transduction histidine kinase, LytS [Croceitalea dokdonensis DOKDO 023]